MLAAVMSKQLLIMWFNANTLEFLCFITFIKQNIYIYQMLEL